MGAQTTLHTHSGILCGSEKGGPQKHATIWLNLGVSVDDRRAAHHSELSDLNNYHLSGSQFCGEALQAGLSWAVLVVLVGFPPQSWTVESQLGGSTFKGWLAVSWGDDGGSWAVQFPSPSRPAQSCSHGYRSFRENEEGQKASGCLSSGMAPCHVCHIVLYSSKTQRMAGLDVRDRESTPSPDAAVAKGRRSHGQEPPQQVCWAVRY